MQPDKSKNLVTPSNLVSLFIMGMRGGALAAKFALTVYLAKFVGLEALGQYGLIAGAVAVCPVVLGFGLVQSLGRVLVSRGFSAIYRSMRGYWFVLIIIYACLAAMALVADAEHAFGMSISSVILVFVILLLEHLNNDAFILISSLKRPLFANLQIFSRSAGWIVAYMACAYFWPELRTLEGMLAFWGVGVAISLLLFFVGCARDIGVARAVGREESADLLKNASKSWMLYAGEVFNGTSFYLDRYLVGGVLGIKAVGVYVLFSSLGMGIYNLANTGIMQVFRPYLIELHARGSVAEFKRVHYDCATKTLRSVTALALACGIAFHFVVAYLDQPLVEEYESLLWVTLVGVVIRIWSDLQGYVFFTRSQDGLFASTTALSLVTAVAANLALLHAWGLVGGAVAYVLTYSVTLAARTVLVRRSFALVPDSALVTSSERHS